MIRLMTLAPGHFHAALVQKRPLYGVHPRAHVYGPLDADTVAHVGRVAAFNNRRDAPTGWELDVRAGGDYLDRFAREQPGNTVVLSGRNRPKIDLMRLAVECGLNVIADKPWIVDHADLPKLGEVLRQAELREVFVWDVLTERFEITNWLQRELVRDPTLFGSWLAGSPQSPALELHSTHHLKKAVNGEPLVRPWWWFDPDVSGEAMSDVGTHLADLAIWLVAPDQAVDHATDVRMVAADRTPLVLSEHEFGLVTGLPGYPPALWPQTVNGQLYYAGDATATFALRGVYVRLRTEWEYESKGTDLHQSTARGTRATVSVRQPPGGWADLFIAATDPADHPALFGKLRDKCAALQRELTGLSVADLGTEVQFLIPDSWRADHEDHFGAVMDEFVRYFHSPRAIPPWEQPNALARYYITTKAVEMARG
jgi:hypothetical protein